MHHALLITAIVVCFALPAFLLLRACIAAGRADRQPCTLAPRAQVLPGGAPPYALCFQDDAHAQREIQVS